MSGIVPEQQSGGGTQYTDGAAAPANPVGTMPVFDNAGVITAVSDVSPLPVSASFTPSGTQDVDVVANTVGLATSLKQDDQTTLLTSIAGEDFATQTTLAALNTKVPSQGQAAMAASVPVVIANNQSAVPVSGAVTVAGAVVLDNSSEVRVAYEGVILEIAQNDISNRQTGISAFVRDISGGKDRKVDGVVLANSTPMFVAIADGNGDQITTFGGGTQYADGAAEATPTGTVAMGTDGANVFAVHTDTSGDLQVDVLTMPTTTVQATNLDIRDLVFASDKVDASGSVLGAGTNNIGDVDVLTLPSLPAGTNNIGDVDILSIAAGDNNIGNVDIVTMPNVVIGSGTVTAVTSITNTVNTKEVRSATPSQTSPSVTNANTSILASNANRLGATIWNEGTATCYMKLGSTASTTSYTLQIAQGGYYEVPFGYTGAIDGITSASTAQLRVTELTS